MNDVRLIEFRLLELIAEGTFSGQGRYFLVGDQTVRDLVHPIDSAEIIVSMLEDLHIDCPVDVKTKTLALYLRGDYHYHDLNKGVMTTNEWSNPRDSLINRIRTTAHQFTITWRGRKRIEELRAQLMSDRIFERFGILLDLRYYPQDLERELVRSNIAVLALDLDNFKPINENFGHPAGDETLKTYLRIVSEVVGTFGTAYRGVGDEVQIILPGFTLDRAVEMGESIRERVKASRTTYQEVVLTPVTVSVGVAAHPPSDRSPRLEDIADERQRRAKTNGRDQVVST
jgi:diguanylate cyclase (GGDEF)-like protein